MSKSRRIAEFDYIRVIAVFGILVCHSCFEFDPSISNIGRYLALTFNFLFLILSAFLLGMAWKDQGHPQYNVSYLSKRVVKLSRSYYPYLAALFLFLYFSQDYFSWRNVITHVLYLSWFDKMYGYGHLWFMTMIVIAYTGCYLISKFRPSTNKYKHLLINTLLLGGVIILDYFISRLGLPGYLFPYLFGYLLIFQHANTIINHLRKINFPINFLQFLIINSISILFFVNGIFNSNPFISYFIGIVCAASIFTFALQIFRGFAATKLILWLSGISFEIYLVHEFFLGKYSVYNLFGNPVIAFFLLIILSITAAIILKRISSSIKL